MPDNEVLISELSTKAVNPLTMFELENTTDGEPDSGKTDASALGNFFLGQGTSPLEYADLQTTAKTPIGAINELDDDIADKAEIDDSTISADSAYSSQKIISLMPTNEASGAIASFKTQIAAPLVDAKFSIVPMQSGTGDPSPSNVRTLSGFTGANIPHCGKNILNLDTRESTTSADITSEIQSDNHIIASGTSNGNGDIVCYTNLFLSSDTYTLSFNGTDTRSGPLYLFMHIKNGEYLSPISIPNTSHSVVITDKAGVYDRFILRTTSGQSINFNCKLQIEKGTATTYESYSGSTISDDWTDEAGTVYGGELDLLSGELIDTHSPTLQRLDLLDWTYNSTNAIFVAPLTGAKTYASGKPLLTCEIYKTIDVRTGAQMATAENYSITFSAGTAYLMIKDTRYTDAPSFVAGIGDAKIAYAVTNPTTYQLTPQQITAFVGENNIWHDANGDTAVKFKQDIQGYIDSKIAEVEAMVLSLP